MKRSILNENGYLYFAIFFMLGSLFFVQWNTHASPNERERHGVEISIPFCTASPLNADIEATWGYYARTNLKYFEGKEHDRFRNKKYDLVASQSKSNMFPRDLDYGDGIRVFGIRSRHFLSGDEPFVFQLGACNAGDDPRDWTGTVNSLFLNLQAGDSEVYLDSSNEHIRIFEITGQFDSDVSQDRIVRGTVVFHAPDQMHFAKDDIYLTLAVEEKGDWKIIRRFSDVINLENYGPITWEISYRGIEPQAPVRFEMFARKNKFPWGNFTLNDARLFGRQCYPDVRSGECK